MNHEAAVARTEEREGEFLVTQSRGRKSTKPALMLVGTKMSIDASYCRQWAVEAINLHRVPAADLDALISSCRGNADGDDLWKAIIQVADVAGLEHVRDDDPAILDPAIVVDEDDLAEALEAALTRQTRLPGTGRFLMDRADEEALVGQMWQIKGSLHLAIVSSDNAARVILRFVDMVLAGQLKPEYLTLLAVFPARENDPGSTVLREVAHTLRSVAGDGAAIEGKRRRIAVQALDRLDLSAVFFKALSKYLSDQPGHHDVAASIRDQIAELERSTERLIMTHLPYVRRFASR